MITINKEYFIKFKRNDKKNFQTFKSLCFKIDNSFYFFKVYKKNNKGFNENCLFIPIDYNKKQVLIKEVLK